jgi:phosphatidylglycerol---prolipoprotein diacylglyceryl transferase
MPMIHPNFDPIALAIGPVAVRWYGLMYVIAFGLFYVLGRMRIKQGSSGFNLQDLDDMLFYGALGVILGGRLGYVVFYKAGYYLQHPLEAFYIWQGGMSFHGGLLGVIFAMWLFGRSRKTHFLTVMDFVAPLVPTGLAAGRMGNFINGELWGRRTDPSAPWAMIFPQAGDNLARHPSQLYQFALEGLLLFVIVWVFSAKPRPMGAVCAFFTLGYGVFRFIAEFAREPDSFLGLLAFKLSMGQWLSIPMILVGGAVLVWAYRTRPAAST